MNDTATIPDWPAILAASDKVDWKVEDLLPDGVQFDYRRPFLPEALARVRGLDFLSAEEQLWLSQIRGHGYLYTFGLVEEFILPFVVDHARRALDADDVRTRALLAFAGEEAKHIHLFKRFRDRFVQGFGSDCEVIGPPAAVAAAVLQKPPLAVALVILHIEWMTQRHWLECVRDDQQLEPRFVDLLKHHWMEEAQHARIDGLIVREFAAGMSRSDLEAGVEGYLEIGQFLDDGLAQQAKFDLAALERRSGRTLTAPQRERFLAVQHQALRWTFLGSGMTHRKFLAALADLAPDLRERVERIAGAFC